MPFGFLKRRKPTRPPTRRPDGAAAARVGGVRPSGAVQRRRTPACAGRAVHRADRGLAAARPDGHLGPPVRRAQQARGDPDHRRAAGARRTARRRSSRRRACSSVDPYDLILVTAGEDSLPPLTDAERTALKVHKVAYDVALEVPPFRVIGTVYLHPGSEPDRLLDRSSEMFVADRRRASRKLGDVEVTDPEVDVILVNRFYLRGVEQVDKRTGEPHQKLPGAPLGGVSWQDRSR